MNIDKDIDEAHESYIEHRSNERKKENQSLLDRFAGLALGGVLGHFGFRKSDDVISKRAYDVAQAMLEERERRMKDAYSKQFVQWNVK